MKTAELVAEKIERCEWLPQERAYVALFGGWIWEVFGVAPDGHLDTAYGNSERDAMDRALKVGLRPS